MVRANHRAEDHFITMRSKPAGDLLVAIVYCRLQSHRQAGPRLVWFAELVQLYGPSVKFHGGMSHCESARPHYTYTSRSLQEILITSAERGNFKSVPSTGLFLEGIRPFWGTPCMVGPRGTPG